MTIKHKIIGVVTLSLLLLMLTACAAEPTVDPNLKMTEIAATVQAQLTLSAPVIPTATNTEVAPTATLTITPAPPTKTSEDVTATATTIVVPTQSGPSNDNAKFISDITVPDGTILKAGEQFTKTWRVQNTGKTTWSIAYAIIYLEGNLPGRNNTLIFNLTKEVPPGEFADVSALFTAPAQPGNYSSYWKMYSANGYAFGEVLSVSIQVGTPTATVPPTATSTPKPTKTPTITPDPTTETPEPN